MRLRPVFVVSLLLGCLSSATASSLGAEELIPRTGQWEIVAEQMRVGGAPSALGGGTEALQVCVTDEGRRISVQFPQVGHIVFDLEPGPEERHIATLLPNSFQGVVWALEVKPETELTSIISGIGAGATHNQRHIWQFVREDPSVDYCAE